MRTFTLSWSCFRGLGRILALNDGLLDDTAGLVCRHGLAALEGPGAGAAGGQQRQREPDGEEGGETLDRGRPPTSLRDFGLWTLHLGLRKSGPWTLDFSLGTLDSAPRTLDFGL